MPQTMQVLMQQYVSNVRAIYGSHLRQVILYGSYARGNYNSDSDVDVMILLDLSDMDIKPIAKSEEHYQKWVKNYPFYANVNRDGVTLYAA